MSAPRTANRRRAWAVAVVIGAAAAAILSYRVYLYLTHLREAPRDNVQWSLAQLEVDLLRLAAAVDTQSPDLGHIRSRFDIFYSRVRLIADGQVFADLRQDPNVARELDALQAFLDHATPIVDGPAEAFAAALPALSVRLAALQPSARRLSLAAVTLFADLADRRRAEFENLLRATAGAAVCLILLLATSVAFLARQHRVSSQRAVEAARSQERLAAAIEVSLDALVVADHDGRIIDFNSAATRIFGYPREQAIGGSLADLLVPKHLRAAHTAGLQRYLSGGAPRVVGKGRLELTALRANGDEFPVELSVGEARSSSGPIFIGYIRDISERQEADRAMTDARDRAMAADKAKSDFIAVISHEMRTPLNGLLGALDLLKQAPLDPAESRLVNTATASGELLLRHVNDVLDIARLEAGQLELDAAPLDIPALVEGVLAVMEPAATVQRTEFRVDVEPAPFPLSGDAHRLRQLLLNHVGNALKFAGGAPIEIAVRVLAEDAEGAEIEFSVRDRGPGIAEADRRRIFEDFVTLDAGYDRRSAGSGLGLAICRRIVEAMNGALGVESEVGAGSRFWWRVRLARAAAPEHSALLETAKAPAGARPIADLAVLLVEDNEINLQIEKEMLERAGCRVTAATRGADAVDLARRRRFDVILMDISMPEMDGIEATRAIRASDGGSRDAPIIATTAHALPEERARFLEAGMQGSLIKPIRLERLVAELTRLSADAGPDARPAAQASPAEHRPGGLFDEEVIVALMGSVEPRLFASLATRFCREIDDVLAMPDVMAPDPTVRAALHKLAGSAGVFGATRLHAALTDLQTALKLDDATQVGSLRGPVEQAARETRTALRELAELDAGARPSR